MAERVSNDVLFYSTGLASGHRVGSMISCNRFNQYLMTRALPVVWAAFTLQMHCHSFNLIMNKLLTFIFLVLPIIVSCGYSPVYTRRQAYGSCSRLKREDCISLEAETIAEEKSSLLFFQMENEQQASSDRMVDDEFSSKRPSFKMSHVLLRENLMAHGCHTLDVDKHFFPTSLFASSYTRYLFFQMIRI